jgi:hypothetical protein
VVYQSSGIYCLYNDQVLVGSVIHFLVIICCERILSLMIIFMTMSIKTVAIVMLLRAFGHYGMCVYHFRSSRYS